MISFIAAVRAAMGPNCKLTPQQFLTQRVKSMALDLPNIGDVVVFRVVDADDDVVEVVTMSVVHTQSNYGLPGWYKVYGTNQLSGKFVSCWHDEIIEWKRIDVLDIEECDG